MTPTESIDRVVKIFTRIDTDVARFKLATGLRCPAGCGACCRSQRIYTTVLEMLPAADEIMRGGNVESWLAATAGTRCAGFSPCRVDSFGGNCRIYPWRPTICRLFGFSAVINRRGRYETAFCKIVKRGFPEQVNFAGESVLSGLRPPVLHGYSVTLAALEPAIGSRPVPVNQALAQAIHRLGLRSQIGPKTKTETGSDDPRRVA